MAEAARGSPEAVLEIGNRLIEAPSERLVASAFAEEVSGQGELFRRLGLVDLAHCITLAEQGVIPPAPARVLVAAIMELQQAGPGFVAGAGFGDLYASREAYLARVTPAVGWFGTSRARREALTTAYHLSLRERLTELGLALVKLGRAIVTVAETHVESVMPDYTYLQAAQPTSYAMWQADLAIEAPDCGRSEGRTAAGHFAGRWQKTQRSRRCCRRRRSSGCSTARCTRLSAARGSTACWGRTTEMPRLAAEPVYQPE